MLGHKNPGKSAGTHTAVGPFGDAEEAFGNLFKPLERKKLQVCKQIESLEGWNFCKTISINKLLEMAKIGVNRRVPAERGFLLCLHHRRSNHVQAMWVCMFFWDRVLQGNQNEQTQFWEDPHTYFQPEKPRPPNTTRQKQSKR